MSQIKHTLNIVVTEHILLRLEEMKERTKQPKILNVIQNALAVYELLLKGIEPDGYHTVHIRNKEGKLSPPILLYSEQDTVEANFKVFNGGMDDK